MKTSIMLVLFVSLALLGLTTLVPAVEGLKEDSVSCDSKTAMDCMLCCASRNFNKFDSKLMQSEAKKCRCYTDEKEKAFNEKHGQQH